MVTQQAPFPPPRHSSPATTRRTLRLIPPFSPWLLNIATQFGGCWSTYGLRQTALWGKKKKKKQNTNAHRSRRASILA